MSRNHQNDKRLVEIESALKQGVTQKLECTGGNQELFNQISAAIDCACASEGPENSLCKAIAAGEITFTEPFSNMVNTIVNHSRCGQRLSEKTESAAAKVFRDITRQKDFDFIGMITNAVRDQAVFANATSFFFYFPIMLLVFVGLIMAMSFGFINWMLGAFALTFTFVLTYSFSIFYRLYVTEYYQQRARNYIKAVVEHDTNNDKSLAYYPQALFAIASVVSSNGASNSWKCNA